MSSVFGTPRRPAYVLPRWDADGQAISLVDEPPRRRTVLFTGKAGSGKTLMLDQVEAQARQHGWLAVRVTASGNEPLEPRFVRAIQADLGTIRKQVGRSAARRLGNGLDELLPPSKPDRQHRVEGGISMGVRASYGQQWSAGGLKGVGRTLNELATELGELAQKAEVPVLLMVDNLNAGQDWDLATVAGLSAHVEELWDEGHSVYLIAAGGDGMIDRLRQASGGASKEATGLVDRMDHRECPALSADELRPAVTEPLRAAGIGYDPAAVTRLVDAARGNPGRLYELSERCAELGLDRGLTDDLVRRGIARQHAISDPVHLATWGEQSDSAKELLAKIAIRGDRGLSREAEVEVAGRSWQVFDRAKQELLAGGLVETSGDRLRVSDAGFRDWVEVRAGHFVANAGLAQAGRKTQLEGSGRSQPEDSARGRLESGSDGQRAATWQTVTRQIGDRSFTFKV